jgi:membrane protease YdiL (CAAX protease family)
MKKLFSGPNGLRAGWRFLIFAVIWTGASAAFGVIALKVFHYTYNRTWTAPDLLLDEVLSLAAAGLAAFVMARIEKRSIAEYGLPLRAGWGKLFGAGFAWGIASVALLIGLIFAAGGVTFSGFALSGGALAKSAILWLVTMIVLGLSEEFTFRGYPQICLSRGIGFWTAGVALSLLFGGLHYFGKGKLETMADGVSVTLIALFLVLTLHRTGNLWFAAGWHAAFDYAALSVLGAPNTGNDAQPIRDHLVATSFHGPAWITGGPCGIEASLLIFPVIAALFFFFDRLYPEVRYREDSPSREVR